MLNAERPDGRSNAVVMRTLTDRPEKFPMSLGCSICPAKGECGGLRVEANLSDCLALCCGNPTACNRMCRNNPGKYVDQYREIGGFRLRDIPRAPHLNAPILPPVIPLIYHGGRRVKSLDIPIAALRMSDLLDFQSGKLRFRTRSHLCSEFKLSTKMRLILTGVNHDQRIEPIWTLGFRRSEILRGLKDLGIEAISVPNFSVVLDHPRYDDLHSIKRIGLLFSEFQSAGISSALHPNGRTEKDFERWGRFISEREEVNLLSYEFITGPGRKDRMSFHLTELGNIARNAGRPLDIIVRGNPSVISELQRTFRNVTYIETTGFMKSLKRQRAERLGNGALRWISSPTDGGQPVDDLMSHNILERDLLLRNRFFDPHAHVAEVMKATI